MLRTSVEALDAARGLLPRLFRLEEEVGLVVRHPERVPDGLLRRWVVETEGGKGGKG